MTRFQWHITKAAENLRKHGVDFDEAQSVFLDPLSLIVADDEHSDNEDRFVILGQSARQRLLVVIFTDRYREIRLISARKATYKERRVYEKRNLA